MHVHFVHAVCLSSHIRMKICKCWREKTGNTILNDE